ncbi:MAG: PAS domain S-box protein [Blastocatellales bacterium]|nr:PAS domain S-box protein [Blastocatellales bacterium]
MSGKFSNFALRASLTYAAAAGLWILLSDAVVAYLFSDPAHQAIIGTYKGLAFVGMTALLLYYLGRAHWRRYEKEAAARSKTEQAMREMLEVYRGLFEVNPHPMWVYDRETLRFLAVNRAAIARYGYTEAEFLNLTIADIRPSEDVETLRDVLANAPAGFNESVTRHRLKDGAVILVEISGHTMEYAGRPAKLILAQNVTKRMEVESEIRRLNAELERRVAERTAELEVKNRELETFTYSVSHDLKAPLRGIDGYSRLLLEDHSDKLDDEGRRFLNTVRQSARQMGQLIDDLLAYSRLERRTWKTGEVELRPLVELLAAEREEEIRNRGGEIRVDVPAISISADADALAMALRNLIDNAIKFTGAEPNSVIEISGSDTETGCMLSIKDNGVGFDMKFHDRIFDIFQRLHRSEDYPGTGIGLTIVRKAMQRMGGSARAESEPGCGATFYLEIPK